MLLYCAKTKTGEVSCMQEAAQFKATTVILLQTSFAQKTRTNRKVKRIKASVQNSVGRHLYHN